MLSIDTYNQIIRNSNLNKTEKIDTLISYLNRDEVLVVDGYLKYYDGYNYYQNMSYSASLIKVNKTYNKVNKTEKAVFNVIEHQQVVERIIRLINSICLLEDRLIFIDRKINHYSIRKIMDKYYLSQSLYYQVMSDCYKDISLHLGLIF